MIHYVYRGNILLTNAEALVNPVNTVGVMGAGLAKQIRTAFPAAYEEYRHACRVGNVMIGRMHVLKRDRVPMFGPAYLINFPTKAHWNQDSRLEWIELGLVHLISVVDEIGIRSIAIPPLGCGLGGLSWADVRPLIARSFSHHTHVRVLVYEP